MSRRPRRGARAIAAACGALAVAAPVAAADPGLYPTGPGAWTAHEQFSATTDGTTWTIRSPELTGVQAGTKFEMNWVCPVPGSEIAAVRFRALRLAPPSHLELEVSTRGRRLWAVPDQVVSSGTSGLLFEAPVAEPRVCDVHLRLNQTETVAQQERVYFIGGPHVVVRDVAPPAVELEAPGGWVRGDRLPVAWTVTDNFGAPGVGQQSVLVDGVALWIGAPGPGRHAVEGDITRVDDGVHRLAVQVDGQGAPAGEATAELLVDRTPPGLLELLASVSAMPARASFGWTAVDPVSGIASSQVLVNQAPDGSVAGAWVPVDTRRGARGTRYAAIDVDVGGVPDGMHAWAVRTVDAAGNLIQRVAARRLAVDTTPPSLEVEPPGTGWFARLPLAYQTGDNLQRELGLGRVEFEINAVAGGDASGPWLPLDSAAPGPGRHVQVLALGRVSDGLHALRVRARNGGPLGQRLVAERLLTVQVDTTPPRVTGLAVRAAGGDRLEASWIAEDARAGVARAELQWWRDGAWDTLAREPAADGAGRMAADVGRVPAGRQRFRLVVSDAAGNETAVEAPGGGQRVDHRAPVVRGLRLTGGPPWRLSWSQADPGGGFGDCPTSVQVNGPGTAGQWRELLSLRLGAGPQGTALPLEGLAAGAYRVRVMACDALGQRAGAEAGGLVLGALATEGTALGAGSPLRAGRREPSRVTAVAEAPYGRGVRVSGRVAGGRRAGVRVVVLTASGRPLGSGLSGRDGRFSIPAGRPGPGRLIVEAGPARATVVVRVAPRVTLAADRAAVPVGGTVALRGRVTPAPGRLGRKTVALEWMDAGRGRWRLLRELATDRQGTVRLRQRLALPGALRLRLRAPVEVGWPYAGAASPAVTVIVGGGDR